MQMVQHILNASNTHLFTLASNTDPALSFKDTIVNAITAVPMSASILHRFIWIPCIHCHPASYVLFLLTGYIS